MTEINMNYFGAFIVLLIGGLLSYIIHSTSKCPECGPSDYAYPTLEADIESGLAFHVCPACGFKESKGTVDRKGRGTWENGSRGYIDRHGKYRDLVSHQDHGGFLP